MWLQCGQLGIGSFEPRNEPCLVTGLEGLAILTASAGGFHSAVLTSNGIYTFGGSQYGQLGDLPPTVECSEPTPRRLTALHTLKHTWVDVQCGGTHTAALAGTLL